MIVIGIIAILMVISSTVVATACMLSSQYSREEEPREWVTYKMTGQLSCATTQQRSFERHKLPL